VALVLVVQRAARGLRSGKSSEGPRSSLCAAKCPCDHDAMSATEQTVSGSAPGLRRNAIGLREVLFQSITDMAPGAAIAARSRPAPRWPGARCRWRSSSPWWRACSAPGASGCWPGSCPPRDRWPPTRPAGCTRPRASCRLGLRPGRLADPAAGAAAARVHHGGHDQLRVPRVPGEPVVALVAGRRGDRARRGYYGVRASTRFGTILGISEIAVFLVLAVFFVVHAGSHNTAQVFTTHYSPTGLTGVIGGSVFTLRVRRLRGRRAAGRGGQGPAAHHQARGAAGHAADRPALRFTTYAADVAYGPKGFAAFATFTGTRPGRASRARSTACSGSSCSWPSSTPPSPTPTRA
jgi:hypothetical protein